MPYRVQKMVSKIGDRCAGFYRERPCSTITYSGLYASQGNEEVHADLMRRVGILRDLRRQYRAFIIDEYQDTNPQHFRLLSRLWGRRKLEDGDPPPPASEWDPTICIVGDMKQSIYRFRQAEVTVMKRQ